MVNENRSGHFANDLRDGLDSKIIFAQFLVVQYFFSTAIKNHASSVKDTGTISKIQFTHSVLFHNKSRNALLLDHLGSFSISSTITGASLS